MTSTASSTRSTACSGAARDRHRGSDVSVVMTVRDGDRYLAEALDSILEQRSAPGEVVVVDDGSRDRTPEVLVGYADEVHGDHAGATAASSGGEPRRRRSITDLVAFLDADDTWTPDALGTRVARMSGGGGGPDAVFGPCSSS